ncbi:regulator of RNase E activity RraA [Shimia isoporae]|uniref:Regulator of RNase E activity RraA n=1 Tax=Shimia isoporae TaxID=647720 RepID=A0A4R1N4S6_9RHOB|nr:ribonuclease activity regulator RraA [Shimia isoporae]TCL00773.1 regulator of RNase E activity RraA [Shimia isoporae]
MSKLTPELREALMNISTATLTTAMFKRGFRNIFFQGPQRLNPGRNMVGEAYTLRYIPAREDLDLLESFADRSNPQRKGVEECPEGAVFVIDSRGDASAASAGGILVTRLQTRGVAGVVTDGGFRDTPEISDLDMPAYHSRPSAPTNLISHHAVAINDPIACGGVSVFPGDVIVGDGEGVVCIPAHLVEEITAECVDMTIFEDFVLEMVQDGVSTFGLYPPTDPETAEKFSAWRQRNNR